MSWKNGSDEFNQRDYDTHARVGAKAVCCILKKMTNPKFDVHIPDVETKRNGQDVLYRETYDGRLLWAEAELKRGTYCDSVLTGYYKDLDVPGRKSDEIPSSCLTFYSRIEDGDSPKYAFLFQSKDAYNHPWKIKDNIRMKDEKFKAFPRQCLNLLVYDPMLDKYIDKTKEWLDLTKDRQIDSDGYVIIGGSDISVEQILEKLSINE